MVYFTSIQVTKEVWYISQVLRLLKEVWYISQVLRLLKEVWYISQILRLLKEVWYISQVLRLLKELWYISTSTQVTKRSMVYFTSTQVTKMTIYEMQKHVMYYLANDPWKTVTDPWSVLAPVLEPPGVSCTFPKNTSPTRLTVPPQPTLLSSYLQK